MNILQHLKDLEEKAKQAADSDFDNTTHWKDTIESFVFAFELQKYWPKIKAFVESFDAYANLNSEDELEILAAYVKMKKTRKALEES